MSRLRPQAVLRKAAAYPNRPDSGLTQVRFDACNACIRIKRINLRLIYHSPSAIEPSRLRLDAQIDRLSHFCADLRPVNR